MTATPLPRYPALFKVLSSELRWKLLSSLAYSDRRAQDLAEIVKEKQNLISYHLKSLQKLRLVSEHPSNADARETYFSADLDKMQELYFAAGASLHPALNPDAAADSSSGLFKNLKRPVRVLFLCTHNSARSQMAEGILRGQGGDLVQVSSAGNQPTGIHPLAIKAMRELDIDISGQTSKNMDQFLKQEFDFVITVCDRVKESCPVFPGNPNQIHWSFPDPSEATGSEEQRQRAFNNVAVELNRRIGYLLLMIKRSLN
jgi:thioredoxin type arsenate reductase